MANCPNCGSDHIQLKRETDVNWGRAVVGWALFGVVGGAVGAVTGEDRNVNACLDCGTSWKATDLHKLLQIIKKLTNLKLNLSEETDRIFINDFISEFSLDLESISNIEKQGQNLILEIQRKLESDNSVNNGFFSGCMSLFMLLIGFSTHVVFGIITIFIIIALLIYTPNYYRSRKKQFEKQIEDVKIKTQAKITDAEENLRSKVVKFVNKYYLNDQGNEFISPPVMSEKLPLTEYCPRCDSKLPPPFQSSSRTVCSKCGWSNKPKQ